MATTHLDVCAVVPAAGFGRRMQTECPKQYLSIGNQTILEHSVHALLAHPRVKHVVIAISPGDSRFAQLPLANHPQITVVDGGDERADSVLAGLKAAGDAQWVLLHDCLTRALNEGATITDEASALEYCGFHPQLVEGRADNIKVTRPEDLALAEFYLTRTIHQENT